MITYRWLRTPNSLAHAFTVLDGQLLMTAVCQHMSRRGKWRRSRAKLARCKHCARRLFK